MSYTITTAAQTDYTSQDGTDTGILKHGPVTFGTKLFPVYPLKISTIVTAGSTETIDLSALYKGTVQKLKVLVIKSTRPVSVALTGVSQDILSGASSSFATPYLTYWSLCFESKEVSPSLKPSSIAITAALPPSTNPSPLPEGFPAAIVTILVAIEETN